VVKLEFLLGIKEHMTLLELAYRDRLHELHISTKKYPVPSALLSAEQETPVKTSSAPLPGRGLNN
jgi:hypothetical protein